MRKIFINRGILSFIRAGGAYLITKLSLQTPELSEVPIEFSRTATAMKAALDLAKHNGYYDSFDLQIQEPKFAFLDITGGGQLEMTLDHTLGPVQANECPRQRVGGEGGGGGAMGGTGAVGDFKLWGMEGRSREADIKKDELKILQFCTEAPVVFFSIIIRYFFPKIKLVPIPLQADMSYK